MPRISIKQADTLKLQTPHTLYDAIVGNPPYGRVFRPSQAILDCFAPVITDGYVNLYVLFLEQLCAGKTRWGRLPNCPHVFCWRAVFFSPQKAHFRNAQRPALIPSTNEAMYFLMCCTTSASLLSEKKTSRFVQCFPHVLCLWSGNRIVCWETLIFQKSRPAEYGRCRMKSRKTDCSSRG